MLHQAVVVWWLELALIPLPSGLALFQYTTARLVFGYEQEELEEAAQRTSGRPGWGSVRGHSPGHSSPLGLGGATHRLLRNGCGLAASDRIALASSILLAGSETKPMGERSTDTPDQSEGKAELLSKKQGVGAPRAGAWGTRDPLPDNASQGTTHRALQQKSQK